MAVQDRRDQDTRPFVLHTYPAVRDDEAVFAQDGARSEPLAPYTLLGQVAATELYVPYNAGASDGSQYPAGIYVGEEIPAADIVAGDVEDLPVITHGIRFDEDQLVLENGTLATTVDDRTVRRLLTDRTLIPVNTVAASEQENT